MKVFLDKLDLKQVSGRTNDGLIKEITAEDITQQIMKLKMAKYQEMMATPMNFIKHLENS